MADDETPKTDDAQTQGDGQTSTDTSSGSTSTSDSGAETPAASGGSADESSSQSADNSEGDSSTGSGEASGSDQDGSTSGGGQDTPPLSTALNPQIVQAVGTTNHAVLNGAIPGANGVAYQKVAQAAAYAVQDSTDYMRNIMSMASATTGVAMQKMLAENKPDPYSEIIAAATKAVADAQKTFTSVGEAASSVVKDFDNLA
jgi:hypothetical protein